MPAAPGRKAICICIPGNAAHPPPAWRVCIGVQLPIPAFVGYGAAVGWLGKPAGKRCAPSIGDCQFQRLLRRCTVMLAALLSRLPGGARFVAAALSSSAERAFAVALSLARRSRLAAANSPPASVSSRSSSSRWRGALERLRAVLVSTSSSSSSSHRRPGSHFLAPRRALSRLLPSWSPSSPSMSSATVASRTPLLAPPPASAAPGALSSRKRKVTTSAYVQRSKSETCDMDCIAWRISCSSTMSCR